VPKHENDADAGAAPPQSRQLTIPEAIDLAMQQHGAGNLAEATAMYHQVLSAEPDNPFALHLLGVAAHQGGDQDTAFELIAKAVAIKPDFLEAFSNLELVLQELGRFDEATEAYAKALAINPDYADAHFNLGIALQSLGRPADAAGSFRTSLTLAPDQPDALCKLGAALQEQGLLDDAQDAYNKALAINPGSIESLGNLGIIYQQHEQFEDAIASYDKALALDPDYVEALSNRAALQELGRLTEAEESYRKAIALNPGFAKAQSNLGNALQEMGRYDDALEAFDAAVAADPEYPEAYSNMGLLQLLRGDYANGWKNYRWRRQTKNFPALPQSFGKPIWDGSDISGNRLLVWTEQGVGDEVLNASMIPDLVDRGIEVVLESDARLVPLFSRSFPDVTCIAKDAPGTAAMVEKDIDYCIASGDLGQFLRPDAGSFPDRRSYVAADPDRRDALRAKYKSTGDGLLVGIAWYSSNNKNGAKKSMSLMELEPLLQRDNITLVNLQYGDTDDQRNEFESSTGKAVLHDDNVDQMADLDAFAAQVAAMDLVISVSNTTVHISGAMGVPTWVMLRSFPFWFWGLNTDDCPWNSSIRLFRQRRPGDWTDVIEQVRHELAGFKWPKD